MPKARVHNFAVSLVGGGASRPTTILDGGVDGYECVELAASPSVAHVRLTRTPQ